MKLEFVDNRFNGRQPVKAVFARYAESGNIGIELLCDDEESKGQPWCAATVNIPGYRAEEDEVAIKTYSENEGLDTLLMLSGIIEKTPVRYIKSGFVQIPVYRLTKEAQKAAEEENRGVGSLRRLSLDEKISIKGKLARFGVPAQTLAGIDMKAALFLWNICFRRSIAFWHLAR